MTDAVGLPPGTRLLADPTLRTLDNDRLLMGGSPLRLIRLSSEGAAVVQRWLQGHEVGPSAAANRLARRLMNAGMLHPEPLSARPGAGRSASDITVVIPVKDDPAGLATTLAGLPGLPLVIVDDGSTPPVRLPPSPGGAGRGGGEAATWLIRRESAGGPGVARQRGIGEVTTSLVAFVDAGVEVDQASLACLGRWFDDPSVVAVGPRVACRDVTGYLSDFESRHSPLDLGTVPSVVGPGRRVSYIPTACLVARRADVEAVGGFDPGLRWGEDVDLVWRLAERGQVRYDPSVVVHHPAREGIAEMVRQRMSYGRAAAPLAARHGSVVAPVRMSGWSLGVWVLLLARRPVLAAALATTTAVALARKLGRILPDRPEESFRLTFSGHWMVGVSLGDAAVRVWWPAAVAIYVAGGRHPVRVLVALSWLRRLAGAPGPWNRRVSDWALRVVDDAAYGAGVWRGLIGERSLRALGAVLPAFAGWPPKGDDSG